MKKMLGVTTALAVGAASFAASPGYALPVAAPAASATHDAGVIDVQYRGRRFGRRGFYGRGYGYGVGAGLAGFATGAIIGGALARPAPVYVVPTGGDAVAYCLSRFRSYSPATGTYVGYDGFVHHCP